MKIELTQNEVSYLRIAILSRILDVENILKSFTEPDVTLNSEYSKELDSLRNMYERLFRNGMVTDPEAKKDAELEAVIDDMEDSLKRTLKKLRAALKN
jgi:hypothetical protein